MANEKGYEAGSLNLSIQTVADNTIKTLDAVLERLNSIQKGLGSIKGVNGYIKSQSTYNRKSNQSNGLFNVAKLGASYYMLRKIGKATANIVQAGSDYTETLNLWQVAMRNNLTAADEFVNKMNKAYGISTKTLMNAQATFKNMIGSLGQISDQTAYQLSEALVQMSADFSSLYNVQLKSAFEKMQSMLAGQVRPIRSAGLDMTETTLYQYYQQIGGTKSMRQLNRTEKQLLSILAVYKQMGSAGALGDMTKTLNSFANQSRMMTEYWQELKSWSGLLLKDLIEDWKILTYVNAALITTTEIIKAIAKSRGLGEENFIDGLFETTEATNDAIDELQGKLLDFDKFRSLQGEETTEPAIDQKLLDAISGYSSQIDRAKNKAQEIAEEWLAVLGFTKDANGEYQITEANLDNITDKISGITGLVVGLWGFLIGKSVGNTWIGALIGLISYGYVTNDKFRDSINRIGKALGETLIPLLDAAFTAITPILQIITPLVELFADAITFLDDIGVLEPLIMSIVAGFIAFKALNLIDYFGKLYSKFDSWLFKMQTLPNTTKNTLKPLEKQKVGFQDIAIGIGAAVGAFKLFDDLFSKLDGQAKKITAWATIIVSALAAVTVAWMAYHGTMTLGTAVPIIAAAVGAGVAAIKALIPKVEACAVGASDIDSGTLFVAGEMGKTEAVYTGSNGKTNVANIQQMKTAYSQALREWWSTAKYDIPNLEGVSDSGLYTIVDGEAKRRGKKFANV